MKKKNDKKKIQMTVPFVKNRQVWIVKSRINKVKTLEHTFWESDGV